MAAQIKPAPTILRRKQVQARTGMPCSTLYDRVRSGEFPKPISLGGRAVGWIESEIDEWLAAQIEKSRQTA
ncbi:MAG: AlpA family transcriptional regulator [Azoarcus sp.]|jgi:prophage regulatory protein|nr:AlpA family transcriptional regulator [Azoarcus sp.]